MNPAGAVHRLDLWADGLSTVGALCYFLTCWGFWQKLLFALSCSFTQAVWVVLLGQLSKFVSRTADALIGLASSQAREVSS